MTNQIRERALALVAGGALIFAISLSVLPSVNASHIPPVGLGTATSFAILAGAGVTSTLTSPSTINGNLGVSPAPGASIVVTCAEMGGTIYSVGAPGPACAIIDPGLLTSAKTALTGAITDAAGRTGGQPVAANELGGKTLTHGVYSSGSAMALSAGTLTLDGGGDPNAVFIFQLGSDLTVANATSVSLTNGAQACNVFWKVNSAFIGSTATFVGTILASTQITVANGSTITGRLLASTANVTLINDTINLSTCAAPPALIPPTRPPFTVAPSATATPTATPVGPTATPVSSTATPVSSTATPVAAVAPTATPRTGATVRPVTSLPSTSTDLETVPTWALVLAVAGFGLIVLVARLRSRLRAASAPAGTGLEV